MSDLDGTLSAITLELLNAEPRPLRCTITADDTLFFERDTITEHHPIYGVHESRRWLPVPPKGDRSRNWGGSPMTPRQMIALAAIMEQQGWEEIAIAYHGMPSVGRIQR